jgi:hypothetical protein
MAVNDAISRTETDYRTEANQQDHAPADENEALPGLAYGPDDAGPTGWGTTAVSGWTWTPAAAWSANITGRCGVRSPLPGSRSGGGSARRKGKLRRPKQL